MLCVPSGEGSETHIHYIPAHVSTVQYSTVSYVEQKEGERYVRRDGKGSERARESQL